MFSLYRHFTASTSFKGCHVRLQRLQRQVNHVKIAASGPTLAAVANTLNVKLPSILALIYGPRDADNS